MAVSAVLCLALFFLAENGRVNAFATYTLAIAVAGSLLFGRVRAELRNRGGYIPALALLLLAYMGISAWWSETGGVQAVIEHLGYGVLIAAFLVGVPLIHGRCERFLPLLSYVAVGSALVSALASVYWHLSSPELPPPRLQGLGRLSNPVIAATAYGFAAILCFHLLLRPGALVKKLPPGVAAAPLLVAVALTGSRAAWLGMGLAAAIGAAMGAGQRRVVVFLGVLAITGIVALASLGFGDLTQRALSFRPDIWVEFISRTLATNPVFGAGSGSDATWTVAATTFRHPHGIFVSAFYFGGSVGLGLLIALVARCFRELRQAPDSPPGRLAMMTLVYGCTVGLFDGDNVLTKIDYLWWVLWFPVAVSLCAVRTATDHRGGSPWQTAGAHPGPGARPPS